MEDALAAIRNGNKWLNHKERVAFGGLVYDEFVMGFSDFPGEPEIWQLAREAHEKASLTPERAEAWFGPYVDQVALRKGFVPDRDTRAALIKEASRAMIEAGEQLRRNAEGDFRPDPNRERFPEWKPVSRAATSAPSASIAAIFDGWSKEATALGRTKKTLKEYGSLVLRFAEFLGHDDAAAVSAMDVVRWKDKRLADGRDAKTVRGADLAALKSVFGWAKRNFIIPSNPAEGVSLPLPKKVKARPKGYTDEEARAVLAAARSYVPSAREHRKTGAAKRWSPWLAAYTGARIGEILQLRRQDIRQFEGGWFILITPEAGTTKTKDYREAPKTGGQF